MKTGRARSKEEMPPEPQPAAGADAAGSVAAPDSTGTIQPQAPTNRTIPLILVAVVALIACIVLFLLMQRCGSADEWVQASQVTGRWTTAVQLYAPQVQTRQTWQTSCTGNQGIVQQATCVLQPTGQYQDQPSRTYDEYAFNSYYEETSGKVYEAQGTEFVVTLLGGTTREENNQRLVSKEYLKNDTCQQTPYTVWVDDPQDSTQEIEVYLSDCEVWQTVTVYDSETAPWCQCLVTVVVATAQESSQGAGLQVNYPILLVPQGGKSEQSFEGSVTFVGGDGQYTLTQTTSDPAQYEAWLTTPYYLGIRDGRAAKLSKTPSE
jgi:hypothetical protein